MSRRAKTKINKKQLKEIIDSWNGKYRYFYIQNSQSSHPFIYDIVKIHKYCKFTVEYSKCSLNDEWIATDSDEDDSDCYEFDDINWGFPIIKVEPIDEDERFILCLLGLKLT